MTDFTKAQLATIVSALEGKRGWNVGTAKVEGRGRVYRIAP